MFCSSIEYKSIKMKNVNFLFLLIIFISCSKQDRNQDPLTAELKQLEKEYFKKSDNDLILGQILADSLRHLANNSSTYWVGRANRLYGISAMQLGNFDKAAEAFRIAEKNQDSDYPNESIYLIQNQGALYQYLGFPDSALLSTKKVSTYFKKTKRTLIKEIYTNQKPKF